MNPLDRGTAPPSPQQAGSSEQADNSLQANIANVGVANAAQPATIPLAANASQFQSVSSHPNLVQLLQGDLYYVLKASSEQVITALSQQNITLGSEHIAGQLNAHGALLDGIHIPIFTYKIRLTYMLSKDRLALQAFIKEILTRLEGQDRYYDPVIFISSLLMLGDRQHSNNHQTSEELEKIIETYIPNRGGRKYLQSNWNIDWPDAQSVRQTLSLEKTYVDSITPEIKKRLYLKLEGLESAWGSLREAKLKKRIYYIDAAFAYGATPGVIQNWIKEGRKLHYTEMAEQQAPTTEQVPKTADQPPIAYEERFLASEQAQAATFNPGIIISDEQSPGPSRSTRTSATLRFEPYQRPQSQPLSQNLDIQHQAQALGLSVETLQEFNLSTELDGAFNNQMEALPWPSVTSAQFVLEQGRYVIAPATRMAIGRFIIENCPADARVYRFASLRYGVSVAEIAKWVNEASD